MLKILNKKNIVNLIFVLIILLAGFLRVYRLGEVPKGLQHDEASFLINSSSILETLKDEDGQFLPIQLNSLMDPKPALYSYLQIPFLVIFGNNTFASRLPSALIGIVSIFLFYLLIKKLTKNNSLALLGMILLSVSPWHIVNSRATEEVILSFTFLLANLIFFLKITKDKKINLIYYILFFLTALLGMYSYHSNKIVLLGFYSTYLLLNLLVKNTKKEVKKRSLILFLLTFFSFLLTLSSALTRFSAIGVLGNDLPKALIFEFTTKSTGQTPLLLIRAFYNKPFFYFRYFLENYLAHFDLNYLFVSGGATKRFIVLQHGLFYFFEIIFLFFGSLQLLKNKKYKNLTFIILTLLILTPIPAALTIEEIPSSIRPFNLILPLILIVILGFEYIFNLIKNIKPSWKFLLIIFTTLVYVWGLAYFIQQYFVLTPILSVSYRSRNYEITALRIKDKIDDYDKIVFTNDLRGVYIYLWLEGLISIPEIQVQPLARYQQNYFLKKFIFSQDSCSFPDYDGKVLYVTPASCRSHRPNNLKTLEQTYLDDGVELGFLFSEKLK